MNDSSSNVSNNVKRYNLEDKPKCQNPNNKLNQNTCCEGLTFAAAKDRPCKIQRTKLKIENWSLKIKKDLI